MASGPLLFTPIKLRGITARNRVVVSPMCQYVSVDGGPTDWQFVHFGRYAMGGAGIVFGEETAVEARGRKTYHCAGTLERSPGDARIAASPTSSRRWARCRRSSSVIAAATPARMARCRNGARSMNGMRGPACRRGAALRRARCRRGAAFRCRSRWTTTTSATVLGGVPRCREARHRCRLRHLRDPRRARLSDPPVPLAGVEPPHRCLWRLAREPHAVCAGGCRDGARRLAAGPAAVLPRLGGGRQGRAVGSRRHGGAGARIAGARRRSGRLLVRRHRRRFRHGAGAARAGLSGALCIARAA